MTLRLTSYPLVWPTSWARTRTPRRSPFRAKSMSTALYRLRAEMRLLGVSEQNLVVSTNIELRLDGWPRSDRRTPTDAGAAVYFNLKGVDHVLACDRWLAVEHNLWAIAGHVEALRAQERWGVGSIEQAFRGYKALPGPSNGEPQWWEVLGLRPEATAADVAEAFRELAKVNHPDRGGTCESFERLVRARKAANQALGMEASS